MLGRTTRLRVQYCGNGDECPALDRSEEGGIDVTGVLMPKQGLPPGEATVRVPDTLLPEIADLHINLGEFIAAHHRTDLLRVQTLDHYGVASDGDDYHRYLDGASEPAAPGKDKWLEQLRIDTYAGRLRRNVHIVCSEISSYLRYQFEWCYVPNSKAGQLIRVLDLSATPAAAALFKVGDFVVVEGRHVARMRYTPCGEYQGAVAIGDDAAIGYVALAELAWNLAIPFEKWWPARPELHRHHVAA